MNFATIDHKTRSAGDAARPVAFSMSRHARNRMAQRGIDLDAIARVLAEPFLRRLAGHRREKLIAVANTGRRHVWLVVVVSRRGKVPCVVTAYFNGMPDQDVAA